MLAALILPAGADSYSTTASIALDLAGGRNLLIGCGDLGSRTHQNTETLRLRAGGGHFHTEPQRPWAVRIMPEHPDDIEFCIVGATGCSPDDGNWQDVTSGHIQAGRSGPAPFSSKAGRILTGRARSGRPSRWTASAPETMDSGGKKLTDLLAAVLAAMTLTAMAQVDWDALLKGVHGPDACPPRWLST